jgi:hypothetical protein
MRPEMGRSISARHAEARVEDSGITQVVSEDFTDATLPRGGLPC